MRKLFWFFTIYLIVFSVPFVSAQVVEGVPHKSDPITPPPSPIHLLDTIFAPKPNYLVNFWINTDSIYSMCDNCKASMGYQASLFSDLHDYHYGPLEVLKPYHTNHELEIVGLAVVATRYARRPQFHEDYSLHCVLDWSDSASFESLGLYQRTDSMTLLQLAEKPYSLKYPAHIFKSYFWHLWDTIVSDTDITYFYSPRRDSVCLPVYEVMFDKPIAVNGSFFVSTTCNTLAVTDPAVGEDCPHTFLTRPIFTWGLTHEDVFCNDLYCDSLRFLPMFSYLMRFHCNNAELEERGFPPLSRTEVWGSERGEVFLFPILSTPAHIVDTLPPCPAPGNLRLFSRARNSAVLTWDGGATNPLYQLSCGPLGSNPDSTIVAEQYSNVATVTCLDTGIYYVARVRSRCHHLCADHDTLYWSPWGDSVLFYLGDHEPQSIGPAHADPSVTLQPNPASDRVTLSAASPIVSVVAFTASGVCCHRSAPHATSATLDLSSWPAGLYTLRITTSRGTAFRPLVVQ